MKNIKKTMLTLAVIAVYVFAQAQERENFIGISFGSGIPVGAFAATNDQYYKAGYAQIGSSININYQYKLKDWMGIRSSLFFAQNDVNVSKFDSYISNSGLPTTQNSPSSASCFLIGAYFQKPGLPIYIHTLIGYGSVKSGSFLVNAAGITLNQSDATYGFAYNIGIGGVSKFGKSNWGWSYSVDYVSNLATPSYTLIKGSATGTSPTFSYTQNFINTQIGIVYMLK